MSTSNMPEDADQLLAQIHREFRDGLPARLERLRSTLELLAAGFNEQAAETFFRTAHSLKGTAPAFGADELAQHAGALAERGRRWHEGGKLETPEVTSALKELEWLEAAVERFVAEKDGASPA
jgi:HPt (histidine-containing phosphotransfer) domain-containing protein